MQLQQDHGTWLNESFSSSLKVLVSWCPNTSTIRSGRWDHRSSLCEHALQQGDHLLTVPVWAGQGCSAKSKNKNSLFLPNLPLKSRSQKCSCSFIFHLAVKSPVVKSLHLKEYWIWKLVHLSTGGVWLTVSFHHSEDVSVSIQCQSESPEPRKSWKPASMSDTLCGRCSLMGRTAWICGFNWGLEMLRNVAGRAQQSSFSICSWGSDHRNLLLRVLWVQ